MERKQWPDGKHLLEFEPPDLLHCFVRGPVLVSEAKLALEIMEKEIVPEVRNIYFLVHAGEMGNEAMPAETRKYFASIKPPWRGTVLVGGTPIARLAGNVLMRAVGLLSGNRVPMRVAKSPEEAIEYISQWRASQAKSGL